MYILIHEKQNKQIKDINYNEPFIIKFKKHSINIYDDQIIDKYVKSAFDPKFNKLLADILTYLDEDDSDSATGKDLFNELESLENFLLNNYGMFISSTLKEFYMKNIRILACELKRKLLLFSKQNHLKVR
jgi:hypothetical protein